ncbi:MAG: hypothetical protein ACI4IW_03665 [Oscillospiraceae bacterium]
MNIHGRNCGSIGMVAGALVGSCAAGILVYFTGDFFPAALAPVCLFFGALLGRVIEK